jgi:hypothetical protein
MPIVKRVSGEQTGSVYSPKFTLARAQLDLARMWKLLNRVDGLGPLRETFQEHVTKNGLDAVSRASQGTVGADGKQENMVSRDLVVPSDSQEYR